MSDSIVYHLAQVEPVPARLDAHLEDCSNSTDLNYTLKRLVRGLASPTPGARLGFSIALCEIINRFPQLSSHYVFDLILSATPFQSGMKPSEERDSQFGRLFGIKCITQSGVLFRKPLTAKGVQDQAHVNEQTTLLKRLLEELCELVRRAPWLSESVGSVLVFDITTQILCHSDSALSQSGAINQIAEMLLKKAETLTLEQLSLAMLLQQHSIKLDWESILSKTFSNKHILSEENHEKLCTLLHNNLTASPIRLKRCGRQDLIIRHRPAYLPHFIHRVIISASQSAPGFNLSKFYNHLFERYYFAEKSSPSQARFLTVNCVHTLQVQLAATDRLLHKMAQSVAANLVSLVDEKDAKGSALAKGFASRIRALSPNFDHSSHHKLTRSLGPECFCLNLSFGQKKSSRSPAWSGAQVDLLTEGEESQSPSESFRGIMLTQLCNVINMNTSACTIECASSILRCLTLCGFFGEVSFQQKKKSTVRSVTPKVPFSPQLRELCKARLYTCLFDLVDRTKAQFFEKKNQTKTSQAANSLLGFRPSEVILEIVNSHGSSQPQEEQAQPSECIKSIRKNLTKLRSRAAKTESPKLQNKKEALLLLCDTLYLMTHDEQDGWTEALPLIERLKQDVNTLLPPDGQFDASRHSQCLAPAVANLTECLLFLLSWPIALLRLVVEISFDSFSDCIGAQSLQLLIDQINPPADLPEPEDGEDDSSKNDGSGSGTLMAMKNGGTATDDESVDEEFRNDIAVALGHALSKPTADDDDSDTESDLMNDDEMLALDANLAAIFKRRTGKKLAQIHNTQDLHLRMKVLELIGKFVKLHPAPATRGRLIKPLLELIGKINTSEVVLKKKVIKILEDTTRLSCNQSERSVPGQPLTCAETSEIIEAVHLVAQTTSAADTAESCAKCNLWLIEMIQSNNRSSQDIDHSPSGSLKSFCLKRSSKLRPVFFSMIFKRFPAFGWLLRHDIIALSVDSSTVNTYRRDQMLDLVSTLIIGYPPKSQLKPESLREFDDYICKLKEAILSLKGVVTTNNSEDGLSKEQMAALKSLTNLIKIMSSALRKCLKIDPSGANCLKIWPAKDLEILAEFAIQIPSSPQSMMITRLMEGVIQFVQKSSTPETKQTGLPNGLKRKNAPSTNPTESANDNPQTAKETPAPATNGKESKKSKKSKKDKTKDTMNE
ncbi:hypothetical protein PSHT_13160 [Puccinia striiformis]|uniref:Uncharacterized protein n=1 Tax=Puccinia striiformis TaxID=27350 RepID=A0A2S4USE9_9BASI|nr:hypothetical protein PSHT_13160 [Puccinia striiformis]